MLVATPGQTTAYTLHNNNSSGNTTAASSSSAAPKCVVNNNHNSSLSNTTTTTATPSLNPAGSSLKHHSNFNFHTPPHKNVSNTATKTSKDTNQHSLNNSDNSKPTTCISNLKDTTTNSTIAIKPTFSTNNNIRSSNSHNNTSKSTLPTSLFTSSQNVTSGSSSATSQNTALSSSTILPLTVVRKKISQSLATQPKLHTIPPTILHRYPEERQKASSTDSLQKEMCHFKPIRTVPTTPWKSGSKSRGSSLRFPKANLATTKTEFILKSNCDVNNRMKKKPQIKPTQLELESVDNGVDEQENKEYCERFKPKPSTLLLSGNFETANHQSAFVCLVAQMKNLISIQSTKTLASASKAGGDNMELHKTKSARTARTKDSGTLAKSVAALTLPSSLKRSSNVAVTEIFVRPKKFKSPPAPLTKKSDVVSVKDVVATRSNRSTGGGKTPETTEVSKKLAKTNVLSTNITKAKSRRKLKGAKSKMINLAQLVKTSQVKERSFTSPTVDTGHPAAEDEYRKSAGQRTTRKRKITTEFDVRPFMCKSTTAAVAATTTQSGVPPTPTLRSSTARSRIPARLSTAIGIHSTMIFKSPGINVSKANQRTEGCFSPPLTRARLKLLQNQQPLNKSAATPLGNVKKRKV